MSHQPPTPRTASARTPITQNASIHPVKLCSELANGADVAESRDVEAIPGARLRGKSPETSAFVIAEVVETNAGDGSVERICQLKVITADTSIASKAASAAA